MTEEEPIPATTKLQLRRAFKIIDCIFDNPELEEECKIAHAIAVMELAIERALEKSYLSKEQKSNTVTQFYLRRMAGLYL